MSYSWFSASTGISPDAFHELKTPLTIINANAEVLQNSLRENKWLQHILEQTNRMNLLIRDLLDLARLDSAPKAIAASIVSSHSGQISVKSDEVSYTQITAVL